MKRILTALVILICSASLVGCSNVTNQDVGTVAGGVAGGLLGSTVGQGGGRMVAIAAGTLLGAYLGGAVGKNMDDNEQSQNEPGIREQQCWSARLTWRNQNTGATYRVVPVKNVSVNGNRYCREYRTTAEINGKTQQMYGKACRQPDGSWKAVS